MAPPDLLDFSFSIGFVELSAKHLQKKLLNADQAGVDLSAALRAQMPNLRKLKDDISKILEEAEAVQ